MESCSELIRWHRRRRPSLDLSVSNREASFDLDTSPLSPDYPLSPLVCPSPAEIVRSDLVHRNVRQMNTEYDIDRLLGQGSFGQVHLAVHRRTGIKRAIKEIPKSGTEDEEFEWELRAMVALDHPHIVKVIEYFEDEDNFNIVMELCTGPDLHQYIITAMEDPKGEGFVPEHEVSIILRQCLKAVLCCHAHGFVHRDLNAKNFMLSGAEKTVKLIDFGLATRFKAVVPRAHFIEIVGTSHYMSPEMILAGEYSPASDLWSLGVLLYVLLTGLMLLPKDDTLKVRCMKKLSYVQKKIRNCKTLTKRGVSAAARDLLERMLLHDPKQRSTADQALAHTFVLSRCHENLVPRSVLNCPIDVEIVDKMRRFAKSPRLKKMALLTMSHLTDHERELRSVRYMFRLMDQDGDGEITLQDLQATLSTNNIPEPLDLAEVFQGCNSSASGRLTFVEFVACLFPENLIDERLCHEAFNLLDRENKGCLSAQDLQAICNSNDLERCQRMVHAAAPGRGHFNFEDFHRFLRGEDVVVREQPRKLARLDSDGGSVVTLAG